MTGIWLFFPLVSISWRQFAGSFLSNDALWQQQIGISAEILLLLALFAGALAVLFFWLGSRKAKKADVAVEAAEPEAEPPLLTPEDKAVTVAPPSDPVTPLDPIWTTLVQVSGDVANASNLGKAVPHILQGILRVSGVDGVRTIIFNPRGGAPLIHGTGRLATEMATLDRQMLLLMRHEEEAVLNSAEIIQQQLQVSADTALPVEAVMTFALKAAGRLLGVIWLASESPIILSPEQQAVIRSLVNQAAVLIANARLYTQAEQSVRRLHAVIDSTAEPVAVIDQSNRFYLINPALTAAFDIDAATVKSRQVNDVIDNPELCDVLTKPITDVVGREVTTKAGQIYTAGVSPITTADGLVGRIVVLHDITRLKQIDALKSEFVSNVSHDLRNPLVYMNAYVNMLDKAGPLNEKQTEFVGHIEKGVDRMHNLITALLDLSRIEAGADVDLQDVDVADLLAETAEMHALSIALTNDEIVVVTESDLQPIRGDIWQMRMALDNLVGNALKFAAGSGPITLSATDSDTEVVISVADRGPGIPAADIAHLFDKFYRAAQPISPAASGSGLGLAIVKSVAERHGGRAWCESEPGDGSVFYLAFPTSAQSAETA